MLSKHQFQVLTDIVYNGPDSQRAVALRVDISLGSVNTATRTLKELGALDDSGNITEQGYKLLEPYKVDNAIIMAAGVSSRFVPLSYERPKGLLCVKGDILIERQIRQLQEAGIQDITVVVGYMKEQFFYLEDKFGVKICVNSEYATRNNNSTLMLVSEKLGNTFICSSDNYFEENVFEPYVYQAYYAATFFPGHTAEYLLKVGTGQRIIGVTIGGENAYGMLGHAYFDRAYSKTFVDILKAEYDLAETAPKLWEDIYREHLDELVMVMRPYDASVIHEFDSLAELQVFDPLFIENVDSRILDNICSTLGVARSDISGIEPIKQGLTNLSFKFVVGDKAYVYRHPSAAPDAVINRESEAYSESIARDLGLDKTFIHEDPREGWKISLYLPDCTHLDYHDWKQVCQALAMMRTLHGSGATSKWTFNAFEKAQELIRLLNEQHRLSFPEFEVLYQQIENLVQHVQNDGTPLCLCHNDVYDNNFLISGQDMCLIDWEFSGMSDFASDLGTFICCSDYDLEMADKVLKEYFQRDLTAAERAHCLSYIAINSFYWFVWALYKDACGASIGKGLYLWYRDAKDFGKVAQESIAAL